MKDTALLLIDIQNDYFPGGAFELEAPEAAAKQAAKLLDAFRRAGLPRFHIQHAAPTDSQMPFLVENTSGAEIHPLVAPQEGEAVVLKTFPNSFFKTDLHEQLKAANIQSLVICGMMTQMCVSATARAAFELGYTSTVAADATTSRSLQLGDELIPAENVIKGNLAALSGFISSIEPTDTILKQL